MEETEILKIVTVVLALKLVACSISQATALLMNQHGGGVQHCHYRLFSASVLGQGCCLSLHNDCFLHIKTSPKQKG